MSAETTPPTVTADDLSADVDLSMTCVGLALGAAAGMLEGEDFAEAFAGILQLWPAEVPDAALVVGLRTALAIASYYDGEHTMPDAIDSNDLGTIAATLLATETNEPESEATT